MPKTYPSKPLNIIIADRNKIYSLALKTMLNNKQDIIIENICSTETHLKRALSKTSPSILLLDENFFKGNAIFHIQTIKNQHPQMKIIGLSLEGPCLGKQNLAKLGIDYYISKWIETAELVASIEAITPNIFP
jgi:DNA-binding NarL/FixJ family response regulator